MAVKYVFVTGGVVSGIGKGITAASLGMLLKARGLHVTMQKFDPYINIDPGTMSPYQHGEVFVTEDGAETDLDLGHYERFIDENLGAYSNLTAGKVYWSVISDERKGDYLGGTVQVIPHITNKIKEYAYKVGENANTDIVITEIGGTVGDIESQPFLEAIRQIAGEVGRENCMFLHVTLVPYLRTSGEFKSKPTQHSVKELLSLGIQPDVIVCRAEGALPKELCDKIALFCNVRSDCIIQNLDAGCIYEAPLNLEHAGLAEAVCKRLHVECAKPDIADWSAMVQKHSTLKRRVKIALVGKYVALHDAYISVAESLRHAGIWHDAQVDINWVDSDTVTAENAAELLVGMDGILVPGGFGDRGIEGKINAVTYARTHDIPYLGICLGMQLAVVEFARNVLGLEDANSTEFNPETTHNVIDLMEGQRKIDGLGGTMRLGRYGCNIIEGTHSFEAYGTRQISERHRHRYEFNNDYRAQMQAAGLKLVGLSPDENLVEIVELAGHRWFVGVQFHPEFKSRPIRPHPIFRDFIGAAISASAQTDGDKNSFEIPQSATLQSATSQSATSQSEMPQSTTPPSATSQSATLQSATV
jgi:CTP synthase